MKLNFIIEEETSPLHTRTVMELCDYLTARVLDPMFARNNVRWDHRFMDFFTLDNDCGPLDPTGTIRLVVPPLFAGQLGELEKRVVDALAVRGIKPGKIGVVPNPCAPFSKVMVIPILENPSQLVEPPIVNMSRNRGCMVLRDLLGYEQVDGRYEFAADDLLKRVETVTEDKIAACTAAPLREARASGSVKRQPSAIGIRSIHRCLEEVRLFAQWALRHNYRNLAAA
jgi:hypothetical protein